MKTKIGILGIGAIGSVIAYHLKSHTSNEIRYFNRTQKTHLKLKLSDDEINVPITVQTKTYQVEKLDWLIICLKEHHYSNASIWFSNLISSKTSVVVIRNGLYFKEPLLDFTSQHNIIECLIDCPTQMNDDGFYNCLKTPLLTIPKSKLSDRFTTLFKTNIQIKLVDDFKTESWKKLLESATLGAILCLYDDTCKIFSAKNVQRQYKSLMHESIQIAQAEGITIDNNFTELMLKKVMDYPEQKGSSMLTDMRQGRRIELGAKNGIISELGKQHQIPTPLNDEIVNRLTKR